MPPSHTATLTVVGAGTLLPDAERASASFHLDVDGRGLLLDCGSGALHRLASLSLDWRAIDVITVTHYHSDHVADLPALLAAFRYEGRQRPMTLIGPIGFSGFLDRLAAVFGPYIAEPGFPVEVHEASEAEPCEPTDSPWSIACASTPHTDESVAYRVSGAWGSVGYTGDTGPSESVGKFLRGCTVLVCECALSDPPEIDTHLSPAGAAELASTVRPEVLVLSHVYPPQRPEEAVERVEAVYSGRTFAAFDGLSIPIYGLPAA